MIDDNQKAQNEYCDMKTVDGNMKGRKEIKQMEKMEKMVQGIAGRDCTKHTKSVKEQKLLVVVDEGGPDFCQIPLLQMIAEAPKYVYWLPSSSRGQCILQSWGSALDY